MKDYDAGFLLGLYRTMLRIRVCEERFVEPILSGEVKCPVHLYSGEEAVATGICASLSPRDYVMGSHRSHGHHLAKGGDLSRMVAEIFCRETGCAGGRGGSMHVIEPGVGMLGAAPIVAGTISLSVGAAYAALVRGEDRVSVSFFGDGAAGEGVLYESINLAAVRRLPVVFVCENNLYSTHLPISECRATNEIYRIGEGLGVWSRRVDGNDVIAVFEAGREAVSRCRRGDGPAFIECMTYRLRGHVGPDDNIQGSHTDIRPPEEIAAWRERDPLATFGARIVAAGASDQAALDALASEVEAEVDAAVAFARASSFPRAEEGHGNVFR
jgi:pyruvate dehydrogenase E1 component alpha subunit